MAVARLDGAEERLMAVDQPDWLDASCDGADTEIFFQDNNRYSSEAKAWCRICPIRAACLEFAIETDQFGIWGGMSQQERQAEARRRRKTAGMQATHNLTAHRTQVAAELVAQGKSAPEIAEALRVHLRTAERYLATVRQERREPIAA